MSESYSRSVFASIPFDLVKQIIGFCDAKGLCSICQCGKWWKEITHSYRFKKHAKKVLFTIIVEECHLLPICLNNPKRVYYSSIDYNGDTTTPAEEERIEKAEGQEIWRLLENENAEFEATLQENESAMFVLSWKMDSGISVSGLVRFMESLNERRWRKLKQYFWHRHLEPLLMYLGKKF